MEPSPDIELIVLKYVRDRSLSSDETARLRRWLAESPDGDRMALVERMKTDPDWVQAELLRMQNVRTEAIWSKIENPHHTLPLSTPYTPNQDAAGGSYTAAASIITVVCVGGAWLWL
jgi:hypothetical protein